MDPIGFSLENFDALGRWRTTDDGSPIDPTGQLVDGTKLDGVAGMRAALIRYQPQFVRVITEKLMIYALGRGTEYFDMPVMRGIVRDAEKNNYRFSSLVLGVVKSDPVPDESEGPERWKWTGAGVALKSVRRTRIRVGERKQCSSPKSTYQGERFCAVPASAWRCPCWTP
jgi:hypothetical protein